MIQDLRFRLGRRLLIAGMKVLPPSRYRSELSSAFWLLNFRVQAHCAALHNREPTDA